VVHQKTPCDCANSRMGARRIRAGRARVAVLAPPILPDPPPTGKGSVMSSAEPAPAVANAAPIDPTEARRQRGLAIAALCKITERDGRWFVPAQTGKGFYRVILKPPCESVPSLMT